MSLHPLPVVDPPASPPRRPQGWQRTWRYYSLRLLRSQSSPEEISRGLAVGVFAGCFPIFGLQTITALLLALPFKGNKLMAAAGTWVSNPFTYVPIYVFNFRLGQVILGRTYDSVSAQIVSVSWQSWMEWGVEMIGTLFLGSAVVGTIAALISYPFGLWMARRIQRRRRLSSRLQGE